MKKQELSVTKKMGRPKSAPTTTIRLLDATLEAAESWAKKQADRPATREAIRRLVELGLKGKR